MEFNDKKEPIEAVLTGAKHHPNLVGTIGWYVISLGSASRGFSSESAGNALVVIVFHAIHRTRCAAGDPASRLSHVQSRTSRNRIIRGLQDGDKAASAVPWGDCRGGGAARRRAARVRVADVAAAGVLRQALPAGERFRRSSAATWNGLKEQAQGRSAMPTGDGFCAMF